MDQFFNITLGRHPDQRGLLSIVRCLTHPDDQRRDATESRWLKKPDLFLQLLQAADQTRMHSLIRARLDPVAYCIFLR